MSKKTMLEFYASKGNRNPRWLIVIPRYMHKRESDLFRAFERRKNIAMIHFSPVCGEIADLLSSLLFTRQGRF